MALEFRYNTRSTPEKQVTFIVEPMPLEELVEFLRDSSPWGSESLGDVQVLELNEVAVYA